MVRESGITRIRASMKPTLTDKQRRVYEFIENKIVNLGQPPTIREIGRYFKISSTNGVRTHLTALIKKGYLKKHGHLSRGLELVDSFAGQIGRIKIVGSVPAGHPIDAAENMEGELALDLSFLPKGDSFSLRVTGDSMKGAGILSGDIVLVKKQEEARKGDIVVALINGEATVKRYFPETNRVRLQPENDEFEPIIVSKLSGEFSIAGKVVGLLRRM